MTLEEKVGQLLDVLVGMGGDLQKPSQATAAAAQLPEQADTPAMDRLSGRPVLHSSSKVDSSGVR